METVPDGKRFSNAYNLRKSLAFALELRADDRTLTDEDSEQVVARILKALEQQLGAVLR